MKKIVGVLFLGVSLFQGCKEKTEKKEIVNQEEGARLLQTYCMSCHDISLKKLGPSFLEIKEHYTKLYHSESDFSTAIAAFLSNPSVANTKMPNAVQEYGKMPKISLSSEEYANIASYLYTVSFSASKQEEDTTYLSLGKNIALSTQKVLGKNLKTALEKGGALYALSFCNEQAIALTDSMAVKKNASIKRVSDLNRNPNNAANAQELAYINQAKASLLKGEKISPLLTETKNKATGYYPITTNQLCLQCHGKPDAVKEETRLKIKELYPNDKALGYGINELRGIWVISFDK